MSRAIKPSSGGNVSMCLLKMLTYHSDTVAYAKRVYGYLLLASGIRRRPLSYR
jgi:hypothetical protein